MIRHICMFRFKEDRKANAAEFIKRAESLKVIPQIKRFEIVENDPRTPDDNYDLSLIFDFDSPEDLKAYQVSEPHVEFGKFVGTVRELRACIDYEF